MIGIAIAIEISISNEDRDLDRDLNFGDRGHALLIFSYTFVYFPYSFLGGFLFRSSLPYSSEIEK